MESTVNESSKYTNLESNVFNQSNNKLYSSEGDAFNSLYNAEQNQISSENSLGKVNKLDNKVLNLNMQFSLIGFLIGILLLITINIGPYMYYKFIKNKKITKSAVIEPKHTI